MAGGSQRADAGDATKGLFAAFADRLREAPIVRLMGAVSFAWFFLMGMRTPVDVDEGYYALAAELVMEGRLPYRDFFYPQPPIHPYLLAPFVLLLGSRFMALRIVSSAFGGLAGLLVAYAVHRQTRSRLATIATVVLFVTHELSWQWLITIRPYGPGVVCILGSLILATPPDREPTRRELVLSGALAIAAPLLRLPLGPAFGVVPLLLLFRATNAGLRRGLLVFTVIVVGASMGRHPAAAAILASLVATAIAIAGPGARKGIQQTAWYVLGATLVAAPILALCMQHRESFLYGLVGYHADSSSFVTFPKNRPYLSAVIGGGAIGELSAMGTQTTLLLVPAIVGLFFPRPQVQMACLVGAGALVMGASRHEPMSEHYLTPVVPYLALCAGYALGRLDQRARAPEADRTLSITIATVVGLYLLVGSSSIDRKWGRGRYGGWDNSGFRPHALDEKLAAVTRAVRAHPGPLLPLWPGSALGNAKWVMHGYENHFTRLVVPKRTPAEQKALFLTSMSDVRKEITKRTPSVVVLDREAGIEATRKELEEFVERSRYERVETVGDVGVYVRK